MAKLRIWIFFAISFFLFFFGPSLTVEASAGIQDGGSLVADPDLYGPDDDAAKPSDFNKEDSSIITKILLAPLNFVGDFLSWLLEQCGITMKNVVFGRIDGGGVLLNGIRTNLFGFELKKGNIYGIVGSFVYSMVRGIIYVVMICILLSKVVAASYSSNGTKALTSLKEGVGKGLLAFLMLALMPYFVDLLLYFRDVVLNSVGLTGAQKLFGFDGGASVTDVFYELRNQSLVNSLMYLASLVLVLYFASNYVMLALSYVVSFIAFPFVCLNMQYDKNAIGTWWKNILCYTLVPVIDSTLLLIPAYIGTYSSGSLAFATVQILICYSLLPARAGMRSLLGIGGSMGSEMAGIGSLMMAGHLLSGATSNTVGRLKAARDEHKQRRFSEGLASMEDRLADQEEGKQGGNGGFVKNPSQEPLQNYSPEQAGDGTHPNLESESGGGAAGAFAQNPYDQFATTENFNSPQFEHNISHRKRAELIRQHNNELYGKHGGITAARTLAGIAGSVYGGMAGAGMGAALSPAASSMFAAGGAKLGGKWGECVVRSVTTPRSHVNKPMNGGRSANQPPIGIDPFAATQDSLDPTIPQPQILNEPFLPETEHGTASQDPLVDVRRPTFQSVGGYGEVFQNACRDVSGSLNTQEYMGTLDAIFHKVNHEHANSSPEAKQKVFHQEVSAEMGSRLQQSLLKKYSDGQYTSTGDLNTDLNGINTGVNTYVKYAEQAFSKTGLLEKLNYRFETKPTGARKSPLAVNNKRDEGRHPVRL